MIDFKRLWRALFILTFIAALCGSFAFPEMDRPVKAAPKMRVLDDLIISEIRLHGSGGPNDEFIEIFNPTGNAINLNGYRIDANSGNRYTFSDFSLESGQHFLLAHTGFDDGIEADAVYLQSIADSGGIALIFQSIIDGNVVDEIIDSVGLSDSNYYEGTPLPPLTENIDQSYDRISDATDLCKDTSDNSVDFFLRNPSDPQNSKDAFTPLFCSNPTSTPTPTATATDTPTATSTPTVNVPGTYHSVIINEIAWSGTRGDNSDEWIELYNPTDNAIDLSGWELKSDDGSPKISLNSLQIAEKSFLLLARNVDTFKNLTPDLIYGTQGSNQELRDGGEILRLTNKSGTTIDVANSYTGYGFTKWVAGTGSPNFASMERGAYLFNHPSEWVTYGGSGKPEIVDSAGHIIFGTPGDTNWINAAARSITTIVADTPDPSVINGLVTVTVTVVGGTSIPSGTVAITGANTNCTITLSSGQGSCAIRFTSAGSKTITATYNADASHPSSTDTETHQVSTSLLTTPTPTFVPTPVPPPPLVVINEFVPRPGHDWNNDGVVNVSDEYIEVLNHGVVNVNLSGYTLDDEVNIGSEPYRLPSVTIRPGERYVFYGSETGILLGDGGDGVRLLKPNGQVADAYNYTVVERPDQSFCRLPDNGGADDWNQNCYPTPGLPNSFNEDTSEPPGNTTELYCPIADTLPDAFAQAECEPFGNNIWRPEFWDQTGWYGEQRLPGNNTKWPVFAN